LYAVAHPMSEGPTRRRVETSLAPLLRHFTGLHIIVELKNGRSYRGFLKAADNYMNLVLHYASTSVSSSVNNESSDTNQYNVAYERHSSQGLKETLDPEEYELLHIRGPSIRYVHLPGDANLQALIKEGLNRERGALDKYRRGKRKVKS